MTTVEQMEALQEQIRQAPAQLIATRIKRARKTSDAPTLDGLAVAVDSSRQHLIKLEKGQHRPGAELLTKIAEATGRPVGWFLDPDLDPSPFQEDVAA
jgi:transcriptional regulator with XRE-family HTH domain